MLEYLPWSLKEKEKCLEMYRNKKLSILDIELGGECNYNCVYCDSPNRAKQCSISLNDIESLIIQGDFRWVYICGLGEPTFNNNYKLLIGILKLCEKYKLKCSIFSNISLLTEELKEYIKKDILFILFKYDTNKLNFIKSLYGTNKPQEQLKSIEEIKKLVHYKNGTTNIAASIVPTQLNCDEILNIVKECIDYHIFPLLGELEFSGKGKMNYENLFLNFDELFSIKNDIEKLLGDQYKIPICPAVINGVHISSNNTVTVDAFSGLSCHWFWLKEPEIKKLIKLHDSSDLKAVFNKIFDYRNLRILYVKQFFSEYDPVEDAFGGCGGDIKSLFDEYLNILEGDKSDIS